MALYGSRGGRSYGQRSPADMLSAVYEEEMLNRTPGRTPTAHAINEYTADMDPTFEQSREMGVLTDMDRRTNASMDADLKRIQTLNDVLMGEHPAIKSRREADRQFEITKAGEPERIRGNTARDVERARGENALAVAQEYAKMGLTPRGGRIGGTTGRRTPMASTNKALDTSVATARSGASPTGGIGGFLQNILSKVGIGEPQAQMEVDPQQMDQVISDYQGAMTESGFPEDVQEAAIALVSQFPGLRPEEKLAKLNEIGLWDEAQITDEDRALLLRALRMAGI